MCGIVGYVGHRDPKDILLDGLKRLEYRGYDSAGIGILESHGVDVTRCEGPIAGLQKKLQAREFLGSIGLGHTRWATHGAPTEINAHPHSVGSITLVHNGIIENYLEHKELLLREGAKISSDTDSEIVAHLFDREIKKGRPLAQAVRTVLPKLRGSYAFVVLCDQEPDLLIGVRNGVPLIVGLGEGENFLASDVQAILHRTHRVVYLKDGEVALCERQAVRVQDTLGADVPLEVQTLRWSCDQMDKAGYRHYMLKEIHEQPQALAQTISGNIDHALQRIRLQELAPFKAALEKVERITLVGCGTARHAALVAKYYFGKYANLPADVDFGSEFRYRDPKLSRGTLLILISQSGETADTLAALREGKAKGIPTLSVCNVRESSLARESDIILHTHAGPEIGVASTKAFTTQLALLYMLAVEMGEQNGTLSEDRCRELAQDLAHLPLLAEQALKTETQIDQVARDQQSRQFFFFMGRGIHYPIALEGALKLKEITYLPAEGYPAGELKHGPIALVDPNTLVLSLTVQDAEPRSASSEKEIASSLTLHDKLISNIQEVKSRGARLVCLANPDDRLVEQCQGTVIELPKAPWGLNPILQCIPLQLFAYYVALHRGTDVDKPRNLAKSVTVE